jgi:hypothetical protein
MKNIQSHSESFIKFLIIAVVLLFILACFLPAPAEAQDSISLKVQRIRTADGKYHIWLKDEKTRRQYVTVCECDRLPDRVRKGNTVMVARNSVRVTKEIYKDSELEY